MDQTERQDGETRWRDKIERLAESEGRRVGNGWVQEAQRVGHGLSGSGWLGKTIGWRGVVCVGEGGGGAGDPFGHSHVVATTDY